MVSSGRRARRAVAAKAASSSKSKGSIRRITDPVPVAGAKTSKGFVKFDVSKSQADKGGLAPTRIKGTPYMLRGEEVIQTTSGLRRTSTGELALRREGRLTTERERLARALTRQKASPGTVYITPKGQFIEITKSGIRTIRSGLKVRKDLKEPIAIGKTEKTGGKLRVITTDKKQGYSGESTLYNISTKKYLTDEVPKTRPKTRSMTRPVRIEGKTYVVYGTSTIQLDAEVRKLKGAISRTGAEDRSTDSTRFKTKIDKGEIYQITGEKGLYIEGSKGPMKLKEDQVVTYKSKVMRVKGVQLEPIFKEFEPILRPFTYETILSRKQEKQTKTGRSKSIEKEKFESRVITMIPGEKYSLSEKIASKSTDFWSFVRNAGILSERQKSEKKATTNKIDERLQKRMSLQNFAGTFTREMGDIGLGLTNLGYVSYQVAKRPGFLLDLSDTKTFRRTAKEAAGISALMAVEATKIPGLIAKEPGRTGARIASRLWFGAALGYGIKTFSDFSSTVKTVAGSEKSVVVGPSGKGIAFQKHPLKVKIFDLTSIQGVATSKGSAVMSTASSMSRTTTYPGTILLPAYTSTPRLFFGTKLEDYVASENKVYNKKFSEFMKDKRKIAKLGQTRPSDEGAGAIYGYPRRLPPAKDPWKYEIASKSVKADIYSQSDIDLKAFNNRLRVEKLKRDKFMAPYKKIAKLGQTRPSDEGAGAIYGYPRRLKAPMTVKERIAEVARIENKRRAEFFAPFKRIDKLGQTRPSDEGAGAIYGYPRRLPPAKDPWKYEIASKSVKRDMLWQLYGNKRGYTRRVSPQDIERHIKLLNKLAAKKTDKLLYHFKAPKDLVWFSKKGPYKDRYEGIPTGKKIFETETKLERKKRVKKLRNRFYEITPESMFEKSRKIQYETLKRTGAIDPYSPFKGVTYKVKKIDHRQKQITIQKPKKTKTKPLVIKYKSPEELLGAKPEGSTLGSSYNKIQEYDGYQMTSEGGIGSKLTMKPFEKIKPDHSPIYIYGMKQKPIKKQTHRQVQEQLKRQIFTPIERHRFDTDQRQRFDTDQTQKFHTHHIPKYGTPHIPKYGTIHIPKYGTPHIPRYGTPHIPRYGTPHIPKYGTPHIPKYGTPQIPTYDIIQIIEPTIKNPPFLIKKLKRKGKKKKKRVRGRNTVSVYRPSLIGFEYRMKTRRKKIYTGFEIRGV